MRYISHISRLLIESKYGFPVYQFDNGVLNVGLTTTGIVNTTPTVTTNFIDPAQTIAVNLPQSATNPNNVDTLQTPFISKAGNTVVLGTAQAVVAGEIYTVVSGTATYGGNNFTVGQSFQITASAAAGAITGTGATVQKALDCVGLNWSFFEAPEVVIAPTPIAAGATAVSASAGVQYIVLTGPVTYATVSYPVGSIITTDGTNRVTAGGTVGLIAGTLATAGITAGASAPLGTALPLGYRLDLLSGTLVYRGKQYYAGDTIIITDANGSIQGTGTPIVAFTHVAGSTQVSVAQGLQQPFASHAHKYPEQYWNEQFLLNNVGSPQETSWNINQTGGFVPQASTFTLP